MQTLARFVNQRYQQAGAPFCVRTEIGIRGAKVAETWKDQNANEASEVEAHVDDSKLVSDGLQGDEGAFEILFSRYRPILYRLAHRVLRNHEEAEDAVQNCSLVAFRKLKSFKYEGAFRSWLARIVVNEAITILRKRKRTYLSECPILPEREEAADSFPHPGLNPEQILVQKQAARAFMHKLSQLSWEQRAILLLCEIHEYTMEEAGAMLQVPPSAIRSRLFRARKQLASTLSSPSDTGLPV
jgi:RNA polymerase sigma-70 factor, ECF subfamily